MKRERVGSTNVHSVGYDADTRTMEVEFHGGGVYRYHNVPAEVHRRVVDSKSVGGALASHVVGKYRHVKQ